MIIIVKRGATPEQTQQIIDKIRAMGYDVNASQGAERLIIGVLGVRENKDMLAAQLAGIECVERVVAISKSYKLVSREGAQTDTVIRVRNGSAKALEIGANPVVIMAGPCTV